MKNMTKTVKTLAVAGMTMGLALGAQAQVQIPSVGAQAVTTTNDYGIVLLEGKAYKDKTTGADITAEVAAMGLTCADGIWAMTNFNFTTTADVALWLADEQTMIKISGQNVVRSATTNCVDLNSAGIETKSGGDLLIKGDGLSDTLGAFGGSDPDSSSYGISVSRLAIEDATVNASAGNKAKNPYDLELSTYLSVSNGVMNATANSKMGIYITENSGGIIVSGTGKINIKASGAAVVAGFSTEPDIVARSGAATLMWGETKSGSGVYTYFNGSNIANDATLTATDAPEPIPPTPVKIDVKAPEGATAAVYTNDVLVTGGTVWSNSTAYVVYTVSKAGTYFENGQAAVTNTLDTTTDPATDTGVVPSAPATPSLLLGVVAQRYPWDGKIDVQYWAKNIPNDGYNIAVTVTLPDGTEASELHECKNGKHETEFNAREQFGEVQIPKGVKVRATLVPMTGPRHG